MPTNFHNSFSYETSEKLFDNTKVALGIDKLAMSHEVGVESYIFRAFRQTDEMTETLEMDI